MPTAVITGGHSGIGYSCARHLAIQYKWNLVLAGRSPDKMNKAAEELRRETGVTVTTLALDTSSLASVRAAAAECIAMLGNGELASLDALLCNAGGRFDGPLAYSEDGYEVTFASNCLGHFLLTCLLAEHMVLAGRIVFTASGTHDPDTIDGRLVGAVVDPDAVVLANMGKVGSKPISAGKRYSTSKLCNVLNAYELHRRLRKSRSSMVAMAFDPGSIPDTGFLRTLPKPVQWLAKTTLMKSLSRRLGVTIGSVGFSGASLARLAADPAYAGSSGKYLQSNDGRLMETRSSTLSYDEDKATKLWNQMTVLVRLQPEETRLSV
ncbi:SDR family NAD(P)-dependent oxidoreductase [Sinorhizobium medicae]|uniref:SDR family NAD(P)-dependent oxidoreductase n=1 Tax=Sinorhizobium medicae TaxID=110321 RepID=UPI000FE0D212|nr:SDR family NAD(P)-dependent oxidoreductase [Sinorhizobium medicae]RVJ14774.1 SDR family NAD(P)-dependent oxidoreductase [Sinorhizobium medicae]